MADSLPLDVANLAGLFCGSILYGIFVVLFVLCLHTLLYRRNTPRPNYILISGVTAMFVLNTFVLALSFSRCLDAFVFMRNIAGGPVAYFEELGDWKEVTRTALVLTYAVLGDVILIYRCWVVWSRQLVVIAFPVLILLAGISMDILTTVTLASLSAGFTVFAESLQPRITAALSLILSQNIIVTSLIVFRIWRINQSAGGPAMGSLRPILNVIIESGAVFVAMIFIFLMTYVTSSNSQYIMVDAINPMIGITFSLLTIRVSRASPHSNNSNPSQQSQTRSQPRGQRDTSHFLPFERARQLMVSTFDKARTRDAEVEDAIHVDTIQMRSIGDDAGKGWNLSRDDLGV